MRRLLLEENELAVIHNALVEYNAGKRERIAWRAALKEIGRTMHDETMLVDPLTGELINSEGFKNET